MNCHIIIKEINAHIDIVAQTLQREDGSLAPDVSKGDVRLDAQDTPRVFGYGGVC